MTLVSSGGAFIPRSLLLESRDIRLSITVQPTIKAKIKSLVKHGRMSDYIYDLIISDLIAKGVLTRKELEDMYYD